MRAEFTWSWNKRLKRGISGFWINPKNSRNELNPSWIVWMKIFRLESLLNNYSVFTPINILTKFNSSPTINAFVVMTTDFLKM